MKRILFVTILLLFSSCAEFERREIEGSPFNEESQCWEKRQPTGVFTRENSCGNSAHIVKDEQGQIWYVYSDCDAASFDEIKSDDSRYDMAPECAAL